MSNLTPVTDPALLERIAQAIESGNVDTTTGAPFLTRAGASIKTTAQGKISFLESIYGKGNVGTDENGEVFYREAGNPQWIQFDESAATLTDIADMTGGAIEAAPPVIAGFSTANPIAMGAASAGGNILRQGVSEFLPGDDQLSVTGRGLQAGTAGLIGGGIQKGVNTLGPALDAVRPHNMIARFQQNRMATPFAQAGKQLTLETGVPFSPGQLSGSRGTLRVEGVARQHPMSADSVFSFDQSQATQAKIRLTQVMDDITKTPISNESVGNKVTSAVKSHIDELVETRRAQAKIDFARVDVLSGGEKIIMPRNLVAEVGALKDEFATRGAGDVSAKLATSLNKIIDDLTLDSGALDNMTAKETERLLEIYGKAARGTGKIFDDLDHAQQRLIAARVFGALRRDLDDAVETGAGDAAEALKFARNNYSINSTPIDDVRASVLGRLFKGEYDPAPEAVAAKFAKMHPSEIRTAMNIIETADPVVASEVRKNFIANAVDAAYPGNAGGVGADFSPAKFNTFFHKNQDRFGAILRPGQLKQVGQVFEALQRVVDRAGMQGSQTAPLLMAWDMAKSVFTFNPVGLARNLVGMITPRKLAKMMTTPEGRQALITLSKEKGLTGKRSKQAATALGYVTSIVADETSNEPYIGLRPQVGLDTGQKHPGGFEDVEAIPREPRGLPPKPKRTVTTKPKPAPRKAAPQRTSSIPAQRTPTTKVQRDSLRDVSGRTPNNNRNALKKSPFNLLLLGI